MKRRLDSPVLKLRSHKNRHSAVAEQFDLVLDRERKVAGSCPGKYTQSHVLIIGAGGMGGEVASGLVRKGLGKLNVCDGDDVELSNLNRQKFYFHDVGRPKAWSLIHNLVPECVGVTELTGISLFFEESVEILKSEGLDYPNLTICCPDNDEAREFASRWCFAKSIPLITSGVDSQSDHGYLSLQVPNSDYGCWQCLKRGSRGKAQCGVAANSNIVKLMSGLILQACDWIISEQTQLWTYRRLSLSGGVPDMMSIVRKWSECPLCSGSIAQPTNTRAQDGVDQL